MSKRVVETNRIKAKTDKGDIVVLIEHTTQIQSQPVDGRAQWVNGTTSWTLANGAHVNTDDDIHFEDLNGRRIVKVS